MQSIDRKNGRQKWIQMCKVDDAKIAQFIIQVFLKIGSYAEIRMSWIRLVYNYADMSSIDAY